MIQTLDDSVGRMLAKLDAAGLREKTIVIFTTDNGGLHVPEGPDPRRRTTRRSAPARASSTKAACACR